MVKQLTQSKTCPRHYRKQNNNKYLEQMYLPIKAFEDQGHLAANVKKTTLTLRLITVNTYLPKR